MGLNIFCIHASEGPVIIINPLIFIFLTCPLGGNAPNERGTNESPCQEGKKMPHIFCFRNLRSVSNISFDFYFIFLVRFHNICLSRWILLKISIEYFALYMDNATLFMNTECAMKLSVNNNLFHYQWTCQ